jgi:hypothetical protein
MKWTRKKPRRSVVGLVLEGAQLSAAHLLRSKNENTVGKKLDVSLTLDPSRQETDLVGREIRNHLDAVGISERHCVVAVPASWVMSQPSKLPVLSPEDLQSFLQIEAERGFPVAPEQLQIARSFYRSADSPQVTQLAVRREQVERLSSILKAAGLKPVSFTLGLAALPEAVTPSNQGKVVVSVDSHGANLLFAADGGVAAFRTCEASIESEVGERVLNTAALARELRITWEQVPPEMRRQFNALTFLGDPTIIRPLTESLANWARLSGLTIGENALSSGSLSETIAINLGARWLDGGDQPLEFLPPRPSRWSVLLARGNSKRFGVAGAAVLVIAAAFSWQGYRRWELRNEWDGMKVQVGALDAIQSRIREYRPWYSTSFPELTILRRVTEAFPDNGVVTAKAFEIHSPNAVSVTGISKENTALLKTLDQLRKMPEVQAVKVEQISGRSPSQFNFTFRWNGNPGT